MEGGRGRVGGEGRGREEGKEVINFGSKGRQILLLTVFSGGNQLQQRCFQ